MLTQIYGARTTDKILYQEGIDVARSAGVRVIAAITEELREERGGLFGGGAP
jgi:hypothetical protein